MQSLINFLLFLIFVPVVGSIFLLIKRIREMPDGNKAREELLMELTALQNRNKKNTEEAPEISEQNVQSGSENSEKISSERSDEKIVSEEDLAVIKAKENAASLFGNVKASEQAADPEKKKKDEAAEKVLQMMKQGKKSGFSKSELDSMIAEFSDNKK